MKHGNLFDSHVHINSSIYKKENITVEDYIQENVEGGVKYYINVCTELNEVDELIKSTTKYKHLYCSVGVHPLNVKKLLTDDEINWLKELINKNEKIVAIGETGLDYFHVKDGSAKKLQQEVFIQQLKLASVCKKPVIIHCREAWDDAYKIVSQFKGSVVGVLHCFTGTLKDAENFIKLGFYVSFAGQLTFNNKKIDELRKVFLEIPLTHILTETDGPYLAPSPYRGQLNKSKYLNLLVSKMAEIKNLSPQQITKTTSFNAKKLFLSHLF
ncbi:TatD family hydrolase [Mycoplasma sp. SG1]|uniref:TatD family hydrolase n=1 Tax=Mycoplasma sp. SG1 TaxID=2810348 RepID=UPI0020251222|nr:TatD family hydrolase [Mycoplasma sp. SG1]URM52820.1 TatD family hydrolase [Mycoplasma sp. SG1]